MRLSRLIATAFAIALCAAAPVRAQNVLVIPENGTAQCNDGSWTTTATSRGACSGHKGIKRWIGARPRNASARCNDGAWWTNPAAQGACSSHGGVNRSYRAAEKAEMKAQKAEVKADRKEMKAERKEERKDDRRRP